jgi:hypothetical protein
MIFFQDVKSRSVYWILFPALTGLLLLLQYAEKNNQSWSWQTVGFNIAFFVAQLVLVTIYFSIRNRKLINITAGLLGLGDVLFILSIAFYLSVFNFLFFYIASLIAVLVCWLVWQVAAPQKNKHIPLAGLQALLFAFFLLGDWWLGDWRLTDDTWLLNLIAR